MIRPAVLISSMLLVLMLLGCGKNAPKLDLTDEGHKKQLIAQMKEHVFKTEWAEYNCAERGFFHEGIDDHAFVDFDCGDMVQDADEAIRVRTRVVDGGLGIIDEAYGVYTRDIRKKRSTQEFLADLTELAGATGIGVIKGKQRVLQIIGVFLTSYKGARKSAQLNFYDEQTTNVLIKRMDASRLQVLSEIRQKQGRPTDGANGYSFDEVLDDLLRYFDVGTLNRAFTELDKQTSIDAEIARLGLLRVRGLKDISKTTTIEAAKLVNDLTGALASLARDLDDDDKRGAATTKLKAFYEKIAEKAEFAPIIEDLKSIANGTTANDTFADEDIAALKAAFDRLENDEPLSGGEYLKLIDGVLSLSHDADNADELEKLMLSIFNAL